MTEKELLSKGYERHGYDYEGLVFQKGDCVVVGERIWESQGFTETPSRDWAYVNEIGKVYCHTQDINSALRLGARLYRKKPEEKPPTPCEVRLPSLLDSGGARLWGWLPCELAGKEVVILPKVPGWQVLCYREEDAVEPADFPMINGRAVFVPESFGKDRVVLIKLPKEPV